MAEERYKPRCECSYCNKLRQLSFETLTGVMVTALRTMDNMSPEDQVVRSLKVIRNNIRRGILHEIDHWDLAEGKGGDSSPLYTFMKNMLHLYKDAVAAYGSVLYKNPELAKGTLEAACSVEEAKLRSFFKNVSVVEIGR
jgi:uncharacterized protein with PhoU and TrkA domain